MLDTWFSSGLLPVSVFGWPNIIDRRTEPDFDAFYPTSLLVTGFDILFFWVARMIMLGCWFAGDVPMPDGSPRSLADSVPFREVYIHALVRDANREKMSKTKGNVIDPIEIVKQYGTDAVRFTLASMASPGTDIAFNVARTEGYRAFANKIWNAARFIFMNVDRAAEIGIAVDRGSARLDAQRRSRRSTRSALDRGRIACDRSEGERGARELSLRRSGQHRSISSSGAASAIGISKSSSCASISAESADKAKTKAALTTLGPGLRSSLCACSRPSCPSLPKNSGTRSTTAIRRPSRSRSRVIPAAVEPIRQDTCHQLDMADSAKPHR